jgi:hypothetical protein
MRVNFIEGALPYAEQLGWHVFPIAPGGKLPAIKSAHPEDDPMRGRCHGECGREGHGVYDATTDVDQIKAWGKLNPTGNVALACGASGLIVLDVDPRNNGDENIRVFAARGHQFPPGPRQRTGNGGWHLLFQHEPALGKPKGKLCEGVDVKSGGGYILAAPSWTRPSEQGPGGPYVWEVSPFDTQIPRMPHWMKAILYPPPRPRTEFRSSAPQDIRPLTEFVAKAPDGNRNSALYWAVRRAAESGNLTQSAERAFLDAALAAGLERDKSQATIQSAIKGAERQ